jgi:hypothetical protein
MAVLGTLRGFGSIGLGQENFGEVGYSITVRQPRRLKVAEGYITGDPEILRKAFLSPGAVLTLENGETVNVLIEQLPPSADGAPIVVNGPVPGF